MNFKDQVAVDVAVFLNSDEFGETHVIDGVEVTCVFSTDQDTEFAGDDTGGGVFGITKTLHCRESDLARAPVRGKALLIDDSPYIVLDISREMGMLVVRLTENSPA